MGLWDPSSAVQFEVRSPVMGEFRTVERGGRQ